MYGGIFGGYGNMSKYIRYPTSSPDGHSRNREGERESIVALTDEFIEGGGVIESVPYLTTSNPYLDNKSQSWNAKSEDEFKESGRPEVK